MLLDSQEMKIHACMIYISNFIWNYVQIAFYAVIKEE